MESEIGSRRIGLHPILVNCALSGLGNQNSLLQSKDFSYYHP